MSWNLPARHSVTPSITHGFPRRTCGKSTANAPQCAAASATDTACPACCTPGKSCRSCSFPVGASGTFGSLLGNTSTAASIYPPFHASLGLAPSASPAPPCPAAGRRGCATWCTAPPSSGEDTFPGICRAGGGWCVAGIRLRHAEKCRAPAFPRDGGPSGQQSSGGKMEAADPSDASNFDALPYYA